MIEIVYAHMRNAPIAFPIRQVPLICGCITILRAESPGYLDILCHSDDILQWGI